MEVIIVAGDRGGDGCAGGPYTGGGGFDTGGYKFQRIRYKTVTAVVVVILVVKIIAIVIVVVVVVADIVALVSFVGLALHQVKQIRDSLSLSLFGFSFFSEVTGHRENSPGIINY